MGRLSFIAKPNNSEQEYLVINSRGEIHCRFKFKDFSYYIDPPLMAAHSAILVADLLNLEYQKEHNKLFPDA